MHEIVIKEDNEEENNSYKTHSYPTQSVSESDETESLQSVEDLEQMSFKLLSEGAYYGDTNKAKEIKNLW